MVALYTTPFVWQFPCRGQFARSRGLRLHWRGEDSLELTCCCRSCLFRFFIICSMFFIVLWDTLTQFLLSMLCSGLVGGKCLSSRSRNFGLHCCWEWWVKPRDVPFYVASSSSLLWLVFNWLRRLHEVEGWCCVAAPTQCSFVIGFCCVENLLTWRDTV